MDVILPFAALQRAQVRERPYGAAPAVARRCYLASRGEAWAQGAKAGDDPRTRDEGPTGGGGTTRMTAGQGLFQGDPDEFWRLEGVMIGELTYLVW